MFKDILNSDYSAMEIITIFTIILLMVTFAFVMSKAFIQVDKNDINKSYMVEIVKDEEKIIQKEEINTNDTVVINTTDKKDINLINELKVEVMAGAIVSFISFLAGKFYTTCKQKYQFK